jgi:hypothetical protein
MMLSRTPPADVSAPIPLVWNVISWLAASFRYICTIPSLLRVLTSMPSIW